MLTGVQSILERGLPSTINSTLFAVAAALTYAIADPLAKAAFVIRGFRIEAVTSGSDLEVELARAKPQAAAALLLLLILPLAGARAAPTTSLSPVQLDRAIRQVTQRPEYIWRAPRVVSDEDLQHRSGLVRFLVKTSASIRRTTIQILKWVSDRIGDLIRWLFGPPRASPSGTGSVAGAARPVRIALVALLLLLGAGIVVVGLRYRRKRTVAAAPLAASPQTAVDLSGADVTADQLPEDEWLVLAEEWSLKGDLRLALRSLYLASLAYLGRRNLIRIQRGKSNLDYRRELARRARPRPELQAIFAENVGVFERSWYGMHDVTGPLFAKFRSNFTEMKACAEQE
jgi:hypothetical protein